MDMFVLRDEISAYIHCWTNSFLIPDVDVVWGGVAASRIVKRNAMVRNHNHYCEFVAVFNAWTEGRHSLFAQHLDLFDFFRNNSWLNQRPVR